jgi:hypothetical protein
MEVNFSGTCSVDQEKYPVIPHKGIPCCGFTAEVRHHPAYQKARIMSTLALVEGGGEDAELSGGGAFLGGQIINHDQPIDVGGLDKSIDLY